MAEVYKAYQPGLDRYVSIKVLHGHLVDEEGFIGRFEREAHAIGRLRHPNIVQAVDFDREEETFFMVMEFIDGPTLKDELKARKAASKPFSFREISLTFSALCSAIDYAHSRGMVHRDIKPANVMINHEGQVVLTDFGIARIMGATQYTQTGALSGTPAYMSPEQGQGERGDERSDIYALGVMLYETATGMVPYDADTPFAVIMKHISEPLPVPSTVNPNIPENVENVILKAMAKAPDDRYQTAGEMARALRDAVGVSPDENLIHSPLITVASAPKVEEVDPRTGPLSADGRTVSSGSGTGEATAWSSASGATTVASDAKKQPVVPILVGAGAVIVVLIVAGLVASIALSSSSPDTEATQYRRYGHSRAGRGDRSRNCRGRNCGGPHRSRGHRSCPSPNSNLGGGNRRGRTPCSYGDRPGYKRCRAGRWPAGYVPGGDSRGSGHRPSRYG
jgi:serine/threonine-protein kinase